MMDQIKRVLGFRDSKIDLHRSVAAPVEDPATKRARDVMTNLQNFCQVMNESLRSDPIVLGGKKIEVRYSCDDALAQINRSQYCDSVTKFDYSKKTHINQVKTAMQVVPGIIRNDYIVNGKNQHILVNGATQAGKTGVLVTFLHACSLRNFVHEVVQTEVPKMLSMPWTPRRKSIQKGLQDDYKHFVEVYGEITITLTVDDHVFTQTVKGLHNCEEQQREKAFTDIRNKCESDPEFKASIGDPKFIKWQETMDFHKQNLDKLRRIMTYMKAAGYLIVPVGDEMHWGAGDDTQMDKLFSDICEVFDKAEHFWIGVTATEEMYNNAGNVKKINFIFPDDVRYTGMPYKKGNWMHHDQTMVDEPEVITYEELSRRKYTGISFLRNLSDDCFASHNKYGKFYDAQNKGNNRLSRNAARAAMEAGTDNFDNFDWYSDTDNRNFFRDGMVLPENWDHFRSADELQRCHLAYKIAMIRSLAGFANWCFNKDPEPTRKSGRGIIIRVRTNDIARDMRAMLANELERMKRAGEIDHGVKITIYNADSQANNMEKHLTENEDDSQRIGANDKFIILVSGAARMAERVPSYVKWGLHLSNHTSIDCDAMLQDIPGRLTGYNKGKTLIVLSQNGGTWLKSYMHSRGDITLKPKNTVIVSALAATQKDICVTVDELRELAEANGSLKEVDEFLNEFNNTLREMSMRNHPKRPCKGSGKREVFRLGEIAASPVLHRAIGESGDDGYEGVITNVINNQLLKVGQPGWDGRTMILIGDEVGSRDCPNAKYKIGVGKRYGRNSGNVLWSARPNWLAYPDYSNTDVGDDTKTFKVTVQIAWKDHDGNLVDSADNVPYEGYAVATSFSFRSDLNTFGRTAGRPLGSTEVVPNAGVPGKSRTDEQIARHGG